MVRTMGGVFYGDFIRNGYIAIGMDDITLHDLNTLEEEVNTSRRHLRTILANKLPELSHQSYYANQLLRFYKEMQVGDIVMIPSRESGHVAIGIIKSDVYEEQHIVTDENNKCTFKKRRKVEWKKYDRRSALPYALQFVFSSRHPISSIDNYSEYLDGMISDCYFKGEYMHVLLRIRTRKDVSVNDFCSINALSNLVEDFCRLYRMDNTQESIIMKIQMESPGFLNLKSLNKKKLFLFAIFVLLINGGGLEIEQIGLDLHTNGLIQQCSEFLDRKADRLIVEKACHAIDSLQIKTPEDIKPLIKMLETKNQGREQY